MSIRFRWVAVFALPALLGVSYATAQETLQDRLQERRGEIRENLRNAAQRVGEAVREVAGERQSNDAIIAGILIAANQQEIALSQFAQQRSQNPQVRQFAQQLAEDHTQFLSKLRQYSGLAAGPAGPQEAERPPRQTGEPGAGIERRLGADAERATTQAGGEQPAAPRTRPGEPNAPRGTNVAEQAGNLDIAQIHRQIGERCLAMTREKLQEKQGPAFDKAFVGTNIPMHIHMLASLEVLQDYASPELQKLLQQGTKTTQQHLEQAEQLMRHLDSGAQPQVPGEPRRQSAPQ